MTLAASNPGSTARNSAKLRSMRPEATSSTRASASWDATRHALQRVVQRRVLRYFRRHDLLDESAANGMLSWQGSGGFSIDASVRIEALSGVILSSF